MKLIHQKQEHTASYYAATANEVTDYPILEGNHSTDICVVGGGFTGIATALTLAERGYSVALIEANRIGWGASGRNGGQLLNGIGGLEKIQKKHGNDIADMAWDLRWRGHDIVYDRIEKYSIQCDFKPGYVEVAPRPKDARYFQKYVDERAARNFPYEYEVWDREKTSDMLGTKAFHGGFVCHRDGHLHPLNLCLGEARAAHNLGVKIFEQSPMIKIKHGSRPTVETASGSVQADTVVLAGNAYSQFEPKHLSNLVFPAGSYIIATEPLPEKLAREINQLDLAVCDTNEIVNYFRLSADNRLLFGGACNYSSRDPSSIKSYIRPKMLKIYPQLKNVKIDYEWGGKIGIVLNRTPTVGRINNNVYYSQGYSGHGVNATHVMGEIVADAISGTMEKFDLFANVNHIRLPGSQWMGNQMIAMGMMYYKLKDRL